MSLVEVSVNPTDVGKLFRKFDKLQAGLSGNSIRGMVWRDLYPYLRRRAYLRFNQEGDNAVGRWAALQPATERFREWQARMQGLSIGPAHPINVRTGKLKDYVLNTFDLESRGAFFQPTVVLTIPSKTGHPDVVRKLRNAQRGGQGHLPNGGTTTSFPPRPVVGLSSTDERALTKRTQQWIDQMVAGL